MNYNPPSGKLKVKEYYEKIVSAGGSGCYEKLTNFNTLKQKYNFKLSMLKNDVNRIISALNAIHTCLKEYVLIIQDIRDIIDKSKDDTWILSYLPTPSMFVQPAAPNDKTTYINYTDACEVTYDINKKLTKLNNDLTIKRSQLNGAISEFDANYYAAVSKSTELSGADNDVLKNVEYNLKINK